MAIKRHLITRKLFLSLAAIAFVQLSGIIVAHAQGITINNIQIVGLEHLDESVVLDAIDIKAGTTITTNVLTELNKNSQYLYDTGYFQQPPKLSLDYYEERTILVIDVLENPLYQGIVIKGNTIYPTEELQKLITLQPGEVTNVRTLENNISLGILKKYQDDGYVGAYIIDFRLSPSGDDAGTVYLQIGEGIVDQVVFEGNEKTRDSLLQMLASRRIHSGSPLKKDAVQQLMQDLYNMGIFEQVEPSVEPSLKEGLINLKVRVAEAQTGQAGIGLGYSTVNGIQGTISFQERNFRGRAQSVSALLVFSKNNPGFELSYSDPYLNATDFFSTSLYDLNYHQQRDPGSPTESEMDVTSIGGSLNFGRRITDRVSGSIGLGVVDYDYTVLKGDPFRDYGPLRRARLQQAGQTRSVTLGMSYDTRDNIFTSHSGQFLSGSAEVAAFGGDFNFRKYVLEARDFVPHGSRSTVGFRARMGLGEGGVPVFEEFRIGGVNSVRGLPEDALIGTKSILLNAEYRFPLDKKGTFVGAAFTDWAWVGESFSEMEKGCGAGVGVRFRIPALGLGAIRLDLGWNLKDGGSHLHFGIGEMF